MVVECQEDGSWTAEGVGPLRDIVVESDTQKKAVLNYGIVFHEQIVEMASE